MTSLRTTLPFLGIAAAQLFWLVHGAMLGCSYHPPVSVTEIPDDKPNFYTCQCDCSTTISQTVRVRAALDDAEQTLLGEDNDGATDLDMGIVPVGVRFDHVTIPANALITAAAIQFTADAAFLTANNGPLNLDVFAVASPDAAPFATNFTNLVGLPRTTASVGWIVPPWQTGQAGAAQRTPDLAAVLAEVIATPGWQSGNAVAVIFAGSGGRREAEAFDGTPARAALLEVTYVVGTSQPLDTCMPPALNPNVPGNPAPTFDQLQADCQGRVEDTLSALADTCQYPPQCECGALPDSQRFNAACNDPCSEVPLDADCSNFDPTATPPTATNVPGTEPVCIAARRATGAGPAALSAGAFGQLSDCSVSGQATLEIGGADGETKITPTTGVVGFVGRPCPGAECTVGLTYDFALDPITFQVRFASDPTFEDLASSGASSDGAVAVGATGFGVLTPLTTASSLRGRRGGDATAFLVTNPDGVGVFVDWEGRACALFGTVAGSIDGEQSGDESMLAELTVQGMIRNQPPVADAGDAQTVECTSPDGATVVLDAAATSDGDGNLAMLAWTRDTRLGPPVGFGAQVEVAQAIGAPTTYIVRALDTGGQGDEASTTAAVVDTTAPTVIAAAAPAVLWPPNHKLIPVHIDLTVADTCDASPVIRLVSISSNEGDLATGSGHTSPDIQDAAFGTDDRDVLLRAERSGGGSGRTYVITYEVEDANGNVTQTSTTVSVPH